MRPSARIPSILAGLVLAAGALVAAPAATAAPAGVQDCEQYIVKHGKQVTDAAGQACYEGTIGNQTSCAASLQEAGLSANVADGACRAAR
ncbi:hypothetical protein [Streptomyces sp. XY332]|uniref:hypothetical protein n=1 Tax=Streptomyces sp. XY332 TaxID=1415561 RepID=UPI0006B22076|nr:hypothetical protein [Streptomyces sp. XY332]KOY58433.1 hypothetical protein ADK59_07970 [Streptomyces sp. XY332]